MHLNVVYKFNLCMPKSRYYLFKIYLCLSVCSTYVSIWICVSFKQYLLVLQHKTIMATSATRANTAICTLIICKIVYSHIVICPVSFVCMFLWLEVFRCGCACNCMYCDYLHNSFNISNLMLRLLLTALLCSSLMSVSVFMHVCFSIYH